MRRIVSRWLLLTAVCGIGCHTGAAEDPPNGPSFGGPISDFPRSEIGEGTLPRPSEEGSEPPELEPPAEMDESEAHNDTAERSPSATATDTDGLGFSDALDAGTSADAASELDAGDEPSTDGASAEAAADGADAEGDAASAGDL